MLSLEDCIGMCGLTEEEVLALAEHEHIPAIAAAALDSSLIDTSGGVLSGCVGGVVAYLPLL